MPNRFRRVLLCVAPLWVACAGAPPRPVTSVEPEEAPPQLVAAIATGEEPVADCPPLRAYAQPAPQVFANPSPPWPPGYGTPPPPIVDAEMLQTPRWAFAFQTSRQGAIHGNVYERATGRWRKATPQGAPKMIDGYIHSTPSYYPVGDHVLVVWPSTQINAVLYDPARDRWLRALPAPGVSPDLEHVVPLGRGLFTWRSGEPGRGYLYEPAKNAWTPLPTAGAPRCPSREQVLRFGDRLLLYCQEREPQGGAWFDGATRAWAPLDGAGAPGRSSGARVLKADDFVVVWGGYQGVWPFTEDEKIQGGFVLDVANRRWSRLTVEPGRLVSDDVSVAGGILYWTDRQRVAPEPATPGEAAGGESPRPYTLDQAEPWELRMQTVVTTYAPKTGRWAEAQTGVDGRPVGLDDGRLVAISAYHDLVSVIDPARQTVCRYPLAPIPFFSGARLGTRLRSVTARGDRLWIWGRLTLSTDHCNRCPPGAPCTPCDVRLVDQRSDGVALAP